MFWGIIILPLSIIAVASRFGSDHFTNNLFYSHNHHYEPFPMIIMISFWSLLNNTDKTIEWINGGKIWQLKAQNFKHPKNKSLVGGFNPSEKYESQLGWWHSQYINIWEENNPVMFQSPPTRWYIIKFHYISHHIPLNIPLNHIKSPLNPITPPFSHGCPTCFR